jgi:hypothetical protein
VGVLVPLARRVREVLELVGRELIGVDVERAGWRVPRDENDLAVVGGETGGLVEDLVAQRW